MTRFPIARLVAAALVLPVAMAAVAVAPRPALAQAADESAPAVSFEFFHDRLAPYGRWLETERWGMVWRPDAGSDFRPYYNGHWIYTEAYGWYWMSDDGAWGDIVYHYGRWVYDPEQGWLWVPGYVWGPAWVVWREGEGETGWLPMPPDADFYFGDTLYGEDWAGYENGYYGYYDWFGPAFVSTFFTLWIFVPDDHVCDRHFNRHVRHHHKGRNFFKHTHDATRYATANNFVVNRGVDPKALSKRTGRPIVAVRLRDVARKTGLQPARIDRGRMSRLRQLRERPDLMPGWYRRGEIPTRKTHAPLVPERPPGPERHAPAVTPRHGSMPQRPVPRADGQDGNRTPPQSPRIERHAPPTRTVPPPRVRQTPPPPPPSAPQIDRPAPPHHGGPHRPHGN
jgi:hypothetical protein